VYITSNDEIDRYLEELPKRFIHFSMQPGDVQKWLLPKADRNLTAGSRSVMVYRHGVFVREMTEKTGASLFDYNFKGSEIHIDESRNSNEFAVRGACARALHVADVGELASVFRSLTDMQETFESRLDPHYLCPSHETPTEACKENWQRAWKAVAGESVMCEPVAHQVMMVQQKGYGVQTVQTAGWSQAAARFGIRTSLKVLTDSEVQGRDLAPLTPAAQKAVETAWSWVVSLGMTNDRKIPEVKCFRELTNAEADSMGYYQDGVIFIREDIASGDNKFLLKTAFEEVVHHVTQAGDSSRDIQNFLIDMVVEIAA